MPEERCELTELLASQCGCRLHRPDLKATGAPPASREWDAPGMGPVVEAKHAGWCPACGSKFPAGTQIRADSDGKWVCCGNN